MIGSYATETYRLLDSAAETLELALEDHNLRDSSADAQKQYLLREAQIHLAKALDYVQWAINLEEDQTAKIFKVETVDTP